MVQSKTRFLGLTLGIIIYGGLIEIAQSFTGRTMSLYDVVANTIGALLMMATIIGLKLNYSR